MTEIFDERDDRKFSLQSMAGDSEVNSHPTVVPGQQLKISMPEIQKVQPKLKVKPK